MYCALMHSTGQSVCYKVKRFQVLPTLNQASSRAQILEKKSLRNIFSIIVHFKWPKWPISVRCSFCKRYGYNGSGCEFFSISHSKSQNLFICYWVQSFHALGQKCYLLQDEFLGTYMLGISCVFVWYTHMVYMVSVPEQLRQIKPKPCSNSLWLKQFTCGGFSNIQSNVLL